MKSYVIYGVVLQICGLRKDMVSQDTWLLLKSSFSINSPQILFPFSKNYVSFSVLKIIREVKTSANLKSGDFLFVVPHYPPPLKPTTPHKTLTPACVSQDRKQKKWKEVDYSVWRGFCSGFLIMGFIFTEILIRFVNFLSRLTFQLSTKL